jgi:Tfp pilus assembly protein PilF
MLRICCGPAPKEESVVEQYLHRAQNLLEKNQLSQAKVELQDALKLEPRNSHCHSLVAMVYLRQNQLKMALFGGLFGGKKK